MIGSLFTKRVTVYSVLEYNERFADKQMVTILSVDINDSQRSYTFHIVNTRKRASLIYSVAIELFDMCNTSVNCFPSFTSRYLQSVETADAGDVCDA